MSLLNKVAIVTGGSRGLGRGIAIELASKGIRVAFTYVSASSEKLANEVVQDIEELNKTAGNQNSGPKAVAIRADVGDLNSHKLILSRTLETFNTDKIDFLIHNAGVSTDQLLEVITPEVFDKTVNINLKGLVFLTQEVVPHFAQNGRIISVSSISSKAGFVGQTVYAATKAGVEGLSRVWASELGRKYGITVNCINPGPIETDMWENVSPEFKTMVFNQYPPRSADRVATIEDCTGVVGLLVEEKARWINGDVINCNGGALMY
jgi:3-oxoacyl-[acyl-carrier protein] reductase